MAISMDSFSKEFLQGMCKEYIYIAPLHKVHGNIHGSFLLLNNLLLLYYATVTGTWKFPWILWVNNFLIRRIVIGYMEISTHGPFC